MIARKQGKADPKPLPTIKAILDEHVTLTVECLDRLYLNGHEWAKRQLQHQGIRFEALDNGFWKCADPQRLQQTCDELGPPHIQDFLQRWLQRLPFPLDDKEQQAGYAPRLKFGQPRVMALLAALCFKA